MEQDMGRQRHWHAYYHSHIHASPSQFIQPSPDFHHKWGVISQRSIRRSNPYKESCRRMAKGADLQLYIIQELKDWNEHDDAGMD